MEHVNDWCFRDIYKGGLWDDDLHVCALNLRLRLYARPSCRSRDPHDRNVTDDLCSLMKLCFAFVMVNFST